MTGESVDGKLDTISDIKYGGMTSVIGFLSKLSTTTFMHFAFNDSCDGFGGRLLLSGFFNEIVCSTGVGYAIFFVVNCFN
jgi:hypothetical protein